MGGDSVSIPPWFDSNFLTTLQLFPVLHVSIPPWFDSNQKLDRFQELEIAFQSHRGSIQTKSRFGRSEGGKKFQSHRGSIQTQVKGAVKFAGTLFQSHRGSIQTYTPNRKSKESMVVSIPPWFDSNRLERKVQIKLG